MERGKLPGSPRMKLACVRNGTGTNVPDLKGFQSPNSRIAQSSIGAKSPLLASRREMGHTESIRGKVLLERLHGRGFVVFHVEDGVELGDLQQVVDFLSQVEQLQFAALILGRRESTDQFTDA